MKYAIIDLETGGLNHEVHEALEITALVIDPIELTEVSRFTTNIKPVYLSRVEDEALKINHINREDIPNFPSLNQVRSAFSSFVQDACEGDKIYPIGHNYAFDRDFLRDIFQFQYYDLFHYAFADTKVFLDGLKLMGLLPLKVSTSLEVLTDKLDIPHRPHSSYEDCRAVLDVLRVLKKHTRFDLEVLTGIVGE